jgi:hypothetical protein
MNAKISEDIVELLPIPEFIGTLVNSVFSFTVPVQGTHDISARYCEPEVYIHRTLQLLVRCATYTKNYCIFWS